MAYYNTCPNCGCNLDPGEKCICLEEKKKQQDFFDRHLRITKAGQLAFVFDTEMMEKSMTGRGERK